MKNIFQEPDNFTPLSLGDKVMIIDFDEDLWLAIAIPSIPTLGASCQCESPNNFAWVLT